MNPLDQVTTVRGYAELKGLDPADLVTLRKIQRHCKNGKIPARIDHGAWLILKPEKENEK